MTNMRWDPSQYLTYADERVRPFRELLSRIHVKNPGSIVDLGCGPGNATLILAALWPDAQIIGIDNSPEMIAEAESLEVPSRLTFRAGDIRTYRPERPTDVLVSNAVLQWVPGHLELFKLLIDSVTMNGWFAFQVPAMAKNPSHALLRELADEPRWKYRLEPFNRSQSIEEPATYIETLTDLGCEVDAWETTYYQMLPGDDAVLEWTKGSVLRPYLTALDPGESELFLDRYREILREAYPPHPYGTVYPFRRIFVVAHKVKK